MLGRLLIWIGCFAGQDTVSTSRGCAALASSAQSPSEAASSLHMVELDTLPLPNTLLQGSEAEPLAALEASCSPALQMSAGDWKLESNSSRMPSSEQASAALCEELRLDQENRVIPTAVSTVKRQA